MPIITRFPTSNTAISGTWTNPTNAYSDTDGGAAVSTTIAAKNTTVDRAYGTFGFDSAIPVGSTINSVAINVRYRVSTEAGIVFVENFARVGGTSGAVNSDADEPTIYTLAQYPYSRPGGGSWTRGDLLNSVFDVVLRARSANNATSVTFEWDYVSVTVDYNEPDTTPPSATTFDPASEATGVMPQLVQGNRVYTVSITFDEPIARGTGFIRLRVGSPSGFTFALLDAASSSDIVISGSTAQLTFTNLDDFTNYYLEIPSGAFKDLSDNPWAGTTSYNFTTGDSTPPVALTFDPPNASVEVDPGTSITIEFDEPIQRGTGTIQLFTFGNGVFALEEEFESETSDRISIVGSTFTITPTNRLADDTTYYLGSEPGVIEDLVGNPWPGFSNYSFTTGGMLLLPSDPEPNQTYTFRGRTWIFDGVAWRRPLVSQLRNVNAGTGLTGGGNLTEDRTLGLTGQALAVHNLATNGLITRTSSGNVSARTLTAGAGISITNGDGVSGNPVITATGGAGDNSVIDSTNDTASTTLYPVMVAGVGPNAARITTTATALAFNASTRTLSTTTFSGALSGNATTATTLQTGRAINGITFNGSAAITVPINTTNRTTNESGHVVFISTTATGNQTAYTQTNLRVNPSLGALASGRLYVGTGTPSYGNAGSIRATEDITAYFSDARLKTFHGTIENALAKVLALSGYYFTENEVAKQLGYSNDQLQVGVSAQEVQRVLPEVVTAAAISEEYLTVKYEKLVVVLIEAVKEQQRQIDQLRDRVFGNGAS